MDRDRDVWLVPLFSLSPFYVLDLGHDVLTPAERDIYTFIYIY